MRTHQIRVSGARESAEDIRQRLFTFPEVLEVFATGRSDVLVVVHTGRPRLGTWLAALRAAGYRTPAWRDATAPAHSISAEPREPLADVAWYARHRKLAADRLKADAPRGATASPPVEDRLVHGVEPPVGLAGRARLVA